MEITALSQSLFNSVAAFAAGLTVLASGVAAFAQAAKLRKTVPGITAEEIQQIESGRDRGATPFEVAALANYYNQALRSARISFYFSLLFASIGFGVIIFAFISYQGADVAGAVIKVVSGTVIDAVSGLFFVQSTNSQKSMGEFFEKLRLDRLIAEARTMISEIEDPILRDQLRAQMILKYSGIDKLLTDIASRPAD